VELVKDISFGISSGGFEGISNLFFFAHSGLSGKEIGEFIDLSSVGNRSSSLFLDDVVVVTDVVFEVSSSFVKGIFLSGKIEEFLLPESFLLSFPSSISLLGFSDLVLKGGD